MLTACMVIEVAEYEHQIEVVDEAQKTFVGEGNDAEGHQARVPDETVEIRRDHGKIGDHPS